MTRCPSPPPPHPPPPRFPGGWVALAALRHLGRGLPDSGASVDAFAGAFLLRARRPKAETAAPQHARPEWHPHAWKARAPSGASLGLFSGTKGGGRGRAVPAAGICGAAVPSSGIFCSSACGSRSRRCGRRACGAGAEGLGPRRGLAVPGRAACPPPGMFPRSEPGCASHPAGAALGPGGARGSRGLRGRGLGGRHVP